MENLIKIATNPYVVIASRCLPIGIMIFVLFIMKPKVGSFWDYHGRMGRKKYIKVWCSTALLTIVLCVLLAFFQSIIIYLAIGLIVVFGQVVYSIITIKRLHDLNLPVWIFFIQLGGLQLASQNKIFSYIGLALTLYLFIKRGSENANKYGENPLNKLQEVNFR